MANYDFESRDFALSPQGVHLMRNRFNYKTIDFNDVDKASFTRAVETINVALCLIAGVLLIAFTVYHLIGVYEDFFDPTVRHIYIESIVAAVLPLAAGLYCIYIAIKKIPLLIIESKKATFKLSLKDIIKTGDTEVLRAYLKGKLRERFQDSVAF